MILVADSGSTKTDWRLIKDNKIINSFSSIGLNPYFITPELLSTFKNEISSKINPKEIKLVNFYGAGCSGNKNRVYISEILKDIFLNSKIIVETDLLGAARASFSKEKGIVIILGTGANTCLFDGEKINSNLPSLGYLFGDEGGGDYLGKQLINDYLKYFLPNEISTKFEIEYNIDRYKILDNVYKNSSPNKYFASFVKFIANNISNEYIYSLVKLSFTKLFNNYICKYENWEKHKIRTVGSVAYFFNNILNEVANEYNTDIDNCIKEPADKLAQYHISIEL